MVHIKTKEKVELTFLCIINVLLSSCLIAVALLTKELVNVALTHSPSEWNHLLKYIILLVAVVALQVLLKITYNFILNKASINYELDLKQEIYKNYLCKDISQIQSIHSGEMSNIYINDVLLNDSNISKSMKRKLLYQLYFYDIKKLNDKPTIVIINNFDVYLNTEEIINLLNTEK